MLVCTGVSGAAAARAGGGIACGAGSGAVSSVVIVGPAAGVAELLTLPVENCGAGGCAAGSLWHAATKRIPDSANMAIAGCVQRGAIGDMLAFRSTTFLRYSCNKRWSSTDRTPNSSLDSIGVGQSALTTLLITRGCPGAAGLPSIARSAAGIAPIIRVLVQALGEGATTAGSVTPAVSGPCPCSPFTWEHAA